MSPVSVDGHKYAIGFQDSYSRYGKVYFMKSRDEVAAKFEQYCADIGKPRVLVTDCAKEVVGGDMKTFCRNKGIRQEPPAPNTLEQNGKIERVWATICGMARCMIHRANMDKEYWTYTLNYAFYIKIMLLQSATKQTPYERTHCEKPNLSFIEVFGCKVYSFVEKRFRAKVGVLLGFAEDSKTYIVGLEENSATKKIKTRSVRFLEDEFYFGTKEGQPIVNNIPSNQVHDTVVVGDEVSFNAKKEPSQTVTKLPSSVQEALEDPQWKEAMKAEFDSLCSNKVSTSDLLRKVFHKLRVAISSKPIHQLRECLQYGFC